MRSAPPRPHRWTRERYDACIAAGIFRPDDKVQLIDGELIEMSPQNSPHATAVSLTLATLQPLLANGCFARIQMPLALTPGSEPEPDFAVVRGHPRQYAAQHPQDSSLVVEVADTSLEFDRSRKRALYAQSGIPEYWIVNLIDRQIEVHRGPEGDVYRQVQVLHSGERISGTVVLTAAVAVDDLLP